MKRTPLIAGNWKMHKTLAEARELIAGIRTGLDACPEADQSVEVLVFPSATLLFPMAKALAGSKIMLGAQNVHFEPCGAFTGEISVAMVTDTGCTHVLVGHSERRHVFGETGAMLAKKLRAWVEGGLTVVYCVGETLQEREAGRTQEVVSAQLDAGLGEDVDLGRVILAYEPVWAIGTGRTATPEQAQQVHAFIRSRLADHFGTDRAESMRVLYGGSVKPDNAEAILGQNDVDGVLVGGASLVAQDFVAIISAGIESGTK